jgi:TonB family protein
MRSIGFLVISLLIASHSPAQEFEAMIAANSNASAAAYASKNFDEAEKYSAEAFRLGREHYQGNDSRLTVLVRNHAMALSRQKAHSEAVKLIEEALDRYKADGSSEPSAILAAMFERGMILPSRSWESSAADSAFAKASEFAKASFGSKSREHAVALRVRADDMFANSRADASKLRTLYSDAAKILETVDGNQDADLMHVYHRLGQLNLITKKHKDAIEYLDRALSLANDSRSLDRELSIRTSLVEALDNVGDEARCADEVEKLALALGEGDRSKADPLVRYAPRYPTRAAEKGIEGWVQFTYGIDKRGRVANPTVVNANPKGYFEESALSAFERWRYAPKVVAGEVTDSGGYEVVITFDLEGVK